MLSYVVRHFLHVDYTLVDMVRLIMLVIRDVYFCISVTLVRT